MKYNLDYIHDLINTDKIQKTNKYRLNQDISTILLEITNTVNSPSYNKTPYFVQRKPQPKPKFKKVNEEKYEIYKDDIKKNLNKITTHNYDKLKTNINDILINTEKEILDADLLDNIAESIFEIILISKFNSDIYCKLYYEILGNYSFIKKTFDLYIAKVKNLYNDIKMCETINFEEMNRVNKNNDKIKSTILFTANSLVYNIIDIDLVYEYISHYQSVLNENLLVDGKKPFCEELTELIIVFCINIKGFTNRDIYNTVLHMSNANIRDYKSMSNKIVIKHMNLLDHLRPLFPNIKSSSDEYSNEDSEEDFD